MSVDNVVIFDKPYTADKQAEGIAIAQAVANGWCYTCRLRFRCECDPDFVFPGDMACMKRKREILEFWRSLNGK